jgi:cytochrome P450
MWPFQHHHDRFGVKPGLAKGGKDWQDARRKLQMDILMPQVAASYIPLLATATRDMSETFPTLCNDMDSFCMRAVFDMFSAAILGRSYRTLVVNQADPVGSEFAVNTQEAFRLCGDLLVSPIEKFYYDWGIETAKFKEFLKRMDASYSVAALLTKQALEGVTAMQGLETPQFDSEDAVKLYDGKISADQLSLLEGSYIQRLIKRGALTVEEACHQVPPLVFAGVDTTASALMWFLVNLAKNPDKQALLAKELDSVLKGGNYTPNASLPYLRSCGRESHRISPAVAGIGYRILDTDVELHGYNVPAGTRIHFGLEALQVDPSIVTDPDKFQPERWFPENIAARKGTESEILDHRLIATPFSFGPRMCIGGRLAEVEIMTAVCRLVQDYEFKLTDDHPPVTRKERLMLMPSESPNFVAKTRK